MKRVLFVTNHPGFSKFNKPYMEWFKQQGWIVDNASPGAGVGPVDNQYNISIHRSPFSFDNLKAIFQLRKIINENHYDLIHCHTEMGGVCARLAAIQARKRGTKVIYTSHNYPFYKGSSLLSWLVFFTIEKCLYEAMVSCEPISYTEEEMDFIRDISKTLPGSLEASQAQVRTDYGINVSDKLICDFFAPLSETKRKTCITGSMDIGDVSYIVPTAQINIACYGYAIAGHSWQVAAYAGHSVGMKGMLKAGEVMAKGAKLLFEDTSIIDRAKEEHKESLGGKPYESPLPDGYKPF